MKHKIELRKEEWLKRMGFDPKKVIFVYVSNMMGDGKMIIEYEEDDKNENVV